jgi:Fic family protein
LEADAGGRVTPEIREILNYAEMAEYAIDAIPHRSISVGLLCELQAMLLRGTKSDGPDSGRIRERQVVIGPKDCPVEEARFVPAPDGDLLVAGLRDWVDWLERPRELPIVVQVALAHYQFETLHPFHDGNGRIGRLVIVLQLIRTEHLRDGLLTISPWLEARREEYQDQLLRLSQRGDWDSWVRFFARALAAASDQTIQRVKRLLDRHSELRALVHDTPIRGVAARIVEDLIAQPILNPTWAAGHYKVSYQAANTSVARLVELGVLQEATGRTYDRMFFAPDVLGILEA